MTNAVKYTSFTQFWPFYLREHSKPLTRKLHFIGTALSIVFIGLAIFISVYFIFAALIAGYGFAWLAHFVVEKNRPATFRHPLWSLLADYRMFYLMCIGKMDAELARLRGD